MENNFLKVSEASKKFSLSSTTIRRLVKKGEIKAIKMGKVWRIYPDQFNEKEEATA